MELKTKKRFVLFPSDDHFNFRFRAMPKSKVERCEKLCLDIALVLILAFVVY